MPSLLPRFRASPIHLHRRRVCRAGVTDVCHAENELKEALQPEPITGMCWEPSADKLEVGAKVVVSPAVLHVHPEHRGFAQAGFQGITIVFAYRTSERFPGEGQQQI